MSILDLAERAASVDGVEPFNEASLFALRDRSPARVLVQHTEPDGTISAAAFAVGEAPVEIVVDPAHRRGGKGRRILDELMADGEDRFWAHGDLPAAQALAASAGLTAERTLLVLRLTFDGMPHEDLVERGFTRAFRPDDVDRIIEINGRAFASHPEQGAMDRADFERRTSSDWFDPAGLFVLVVDDVIVGFHWTKVEDGVGEVYVVAVDPDFQGRGLGEVLTMRGLRHLYEQGLPVVDLYVEGDNAPALKVYKKLGFKEHAKDVLYVR